MTLDVILKHRLNVNTDSSDWFCHYKQVVQLSSENDDKFSL